MGARTTYSTNKVIGTLFLDKLVEAQDEIAKDDMSGVYIDDNAPYGSNEEIESLLTSMKIPYIRDWENSMDTEEGRELSLPDDMPALQAVTGGELMVSVSDVVDNYLGDNINYFDGLVSKLKTQQAGEKFIESFSMSPEQAFVNLIESDIDLDVHNVDAVYDALISDVGLDLNAQVETSDQVDTLMALLEVEASSVTAIQEALVAHFEERDVDTFILCARFDMPVSNPSMT